MTSVETYIMNRESDLLIPDIKRIIVNTASDANIIQLARNDKKMYAIYKALLEADYVFYLHENEKSKFYKREQIEELWQRKDLHKTKSVYYTLSSPESEKKNDLLDEKRLLVIFSCMPDEKKYYSSLITDRVFPTFFPKISRSLVKNVYIMRIMDLNCSHGSHYINTVNYDSFEEDIAESILAVQKKIGVDRSQTVLYGGSKGGTGALYHGSKLDLPFLAVDPIVSIEEYNLQDMHFLKGLRKTDLSFDINEALDNCRYSDKYIIASEQITFNFEKISKLKHPFLKILNNSDSNIKVHADVSKNSVPEQLAILNILLDRRLY